MLRFRSQRRYPIQFLGNKKGMVSSGLYYNGSGKPATLSTTTRLVLPYAKTQYKSRANAQRPTPDRCERSSYSQVPGFRPRKIYQTFRSRNKSTTLIQYVNINIDSLYHLCTFKFSSKARINIFQWLKPSKRKKSIP